ncbi:uncharacterized protein PITG_13304 [Phytophthora infestans T30-4]|uniref:Cilia- and flagella-associated protein 45 n=2 Tax=Phytophthora infestans TaxID=4787 RepID=D0NLN2_PHYIT|nr:uncharacterized protein PITG_13304 [Phytophthora infestans T30-4]EEY60579.1 conserved hypothetical protein [Phytophthora infestans T30-4]|eukprot:XP_002899952.1 conserved hypothetical protein [Phytophthora infestans T30-4]
MKILGTRVFTIRDQWLKVKSELEEEHHAYDEKMNTLMEIERLESLKRQEHRDKIKKLKRYADRKILEDQIEDRRREEEEAPRRHEAELRCANLRSMQETMANKKAELGELRVKRAAEARERQAHEADMALARKHKEEMEELRRAREAQALHRERARVKEATMQQREYDSIMVQVESDKTRVKEEDEKRKLASMAHRRVLQSQIEEKERLKKLSFIKKQKKVQAFKEEYAKELEKLERIRMEEGGELVEAGVNPLYLSEMKALVIEKQIR